MYAVFATCLGWPEMQRSVFVCCCTVGAFGDNRNLGAERGVGDIWEESVGAERRGGGIAGAGRERRTLGAEKGLEAPWCHCLLYSRK